MPRTGSNYRQKRDEFIVVMTREGVSLEVILMLLRWEQTMGKMAETLAERDWTEEEVAKDARYTKKVKKVLDPYGIIPIFSDDPRGPAIKLKLKSGRTNDFGNEGYCVPSR